MTLAHVPSELDFMYSTENPTAYGDIKIIGGTPGTTFDTCDTIGAWSVIDGSTNISISNSYQYEGSGCLKIIVGASSSSTIVCTFTSVDISAADYIKCYIKSSRARYTSTGTYIAYFGESTYNEQSYGIEGYSWMENDWYKVLWDLSSVTSGSKDIVTKFGLAIKTTSPLQANYYLDHISVVSRGEAVRMKIADSVVALSLETGFSATTCSVADSLYAQNLVTSYSTNAISIQTTVATTVSEMSIRQAGTYRTLFYAGSNLLTNTGYARIYKNETAFGTLQTFTGGFTDYTEDLTFDAGDTVTLRVWSGTTRTGGNPLLASSFTLLGIPELSSKIF